jgi:hypothetical protein
VNLMNALLALNVILTPISGTTSTPAMDAADSQIFQAFLRHVESSSSYCTPERMAKFASQPEDITWQASKYVRMPLTAYRLTGDAKYLDMFVERMDTLCDQLEEGPDGFMGWYGLPLELFRHPDYPERQVDVMLTSFVVAGLMADFALTVQDDESLKQKYGEAAERYLELAGEHLIRKWDVRGRYKDLGDTGAVYITHSDLKPTKANLTQPHNKHSKIIHALLNMYAATGRDEYLVKAIKLGTRFKRCLTRVDDHYQWHYWDPAGDWDIDPQNPRRWKHWIGSEHRSGYYSLSLSQAVLLYEHGLVFDREDIHRFIRTQMDVCWNGDLEDPLWARVDGESSDSAYLCSNLAPFHEHIYEMAYGAPAQKRRLRGMDHGWEGGVVAGDWLEFKYLVYPRWKSGMPADKDVIAPFLSQDKNKNLVNKLAFQVEAPGYQAPMAPAHTEQTP